MKKISYLIFSCLLFVLCLGYVDAASLGVSANKSTVVVGSTVNVTVTASGAAGWEYCLSFDESLFTLTSAPTDTGGKCVLTGSTLTGYSKVTFTLKAKKSGSGTVSFSSGAMYDDGGNSVAFSKGSVYLTAKTQAEIEASYSTNANLRSLGVDGYEITPEFSTDKLEYSLEVENDVESVNIVAVRADSTASVSGAGEVTLTEGINTFNIVVTAQKGNKKTYVLTINRKELNPIEVNVNGKKLFVVRKTDGLEVPNYYVSETDTYSSANYITEEGVDNEIPVFKSEISGYTLIALKDEDGNVEFYIWDKVTDSYRLYTELGSNNIFIVVEVPDKLLDEAKKKKNLTINNKEVEVYKLNYTDDYVLIYGMNAETGEKNWYKYDIKEKTFQRYDNGLVSEYEKKLAKYNKYGYILIGALGFFVLLSFILMVKKGKRDVIEEDEESVEEEILEEKIKEEKKDRKQKKNKKEEIQEENQEDIVKEKRKKEEKEPLENKEEVKEDTKSEALKEIEKEEEKELSKKELKRLEKERIKQEREELKKMKDDFLDD